MFPTMLQTCSSHFYADDTQIYLSFAGSDLQQACTLINNDLHGLFDISKQHGLNINASKSQAILFGRKNDRLRALPHIKIELNDESIPLSDSVKNLGLIIDHRFRYKKHVSNCIRSAFAKLKIIFHNRQMLNRKTKTLLCNSLVLSKLNYCDTVYGPCLDSIDTNRIQCLQNACMRLIFGIRKYERISHKLVELGWLNMQKNRLLHAACLYHNIITNKSPRYLYNKISFRTDVHNLNLRFKGLLTPPTHSTELFKRSFSYCIVKTYNKIPNELKSLSSQNFKKHLHELLLGGLSI